MKESLNPNSVELTGMTPEQQQEAAELIVAQQHAEADYVRGYKTTSQAIEKALYPSGRFHDDGRRRYTDPLGSFVVAPALEIQGKLRSRRAKTRMNEADQKAEEHYIDHQGAYHEQAIKDAHDAGVDINR